MTDHQVGNDQLADATSLDVGCGDGLSAEA